MKILFIIELMIILVIALVFTGCAKTAPVPTPASAPKSAPAPTSSQQPIKIGILYPETGPVSMVSKFIVDGSRFAFEEANYEVAGRKIEVLFEDTGSQPDMSLDKARKLIEYDRVDMIIGPLSLTNQVAVAPYTSKMGVPHLAPTASFLRLAKHEWFFMPAGSTVQMIYPLGVHAYEVLGFRTINVMTEDTTTGHSFLDAFMDAFKSRGGKVIQEQYPAFPCTDFAPYLTNLKDADAVVAWFQGIDAIRFHVQYHKFGIRKRMPLQAAFFGAFVQPLILRNLPPEIREAMRGECTISYYSHLLETEANKKFVGAWEKEFGKPPDDLHANSYLMVQIALKALEATGGDTTPEKIRDAILSEEFDSCQGHISFDPETRCAYRDLFISRVDVIDGNCVVVPVSTYKAVPPAGH